MVWARTMATTSCSLASRSASSKDAVSYSVKAQLLCHAPRREPAPLTDADVTTPASAVARAKAAEAAEAAARAAAAVEDDVEISPDGLGVDLNRILARRRASGA